MAPRWTLTLSLMSFSVLSCEPGKNTGDENEDSTLVPSEDSEDLPDTQEQELPDSAQSKGGSTPDKPQPDEEPEPESESEQGLTEPVDLPKVTGNCPEFRSGIVNFEPKGLKKARRVKLWVDATAKDKKGPLVYYWHGTGQSPDEAQSGLGKIIPKITSMGGVVAAPFHDPEAGVFPWFLVEDVEGKRLDDLILSDEILACAREQVGIDTRHIHTLGLSAGALQSTQMSYRRSNYIASSVMYSGGLIVDAPASKEARNRFSSMIFHGGPKDIVVVKFQETSERYLKALQEAQHFGFICDHQSGHIIPPNVLDQVWTFFTDHPFAQPSPYTETLPEGFPEYCKLP